MEKENKAAGTRARKSSLALEKLLKRECTFVSGSDQLYQHLTVRFIPTNTKKSCSHRISSFSF
ncbi:hypothetical protein [Paenimyroides ceti]|uniref:hypothetical protein n=1 Tax=Paenimyroides ceti TaxID=395087 RepID=UPI0037CB0628